MNLSDFFQEDIEKIQNEDLRSTVCGYLDEAVGEWFFTSPASKTGSFHPAFSQDNGGLIRHTMAVVMFADELLRLSTYSYLSDACKDYIYAACILHDTCKYETSTAYKNHGRLAAKKFSLWCAENGFNCSELLYRAIAGHMGQWTPTVDDKPLTPIDRCVHLADYFASRSFIDIPAISERYDRILNGFTPVEQE